MYWFITFPNEPHHPLHEKMGDFETVVNLANGNISSQIPQMSRIHKMLKRYSSKRAKQFLARFPSVYWAPDEKSNGQPLYFRNTPVHKFVQEAGQYVAWWQTDDLSRSCFMIDGESEIKDFQSLNMGREFRLYLDTDARFDHKLWNQVSTGVNTGSHNIHSNDESELIDRNQLLRKNLDIKYTWRHDSRLNLVHWIMEELPGFLNPGMEIVAMSNTYFEIQNQGRVIGIIMVIEYIIYLTRLEETSSDEMLFVTYPEEVIVAAAQKDVNLRYTNKL